MKTHYALSQQRVPISAVDSHLPVAFVTRIVLMAMTAVLAVALLAIAPQTVIVPILAVLAAGLVATGMVVARERWVSRRRFALPAVASRRNHEFKSRRSSRSRRPGRRALQGTSRAERIDTLYRHRVA